ncbi:hypothetical protein N9Z72_00005, partial [Akkermansiaceae bacterium]|nr:hypothetical protein [Akkermansiaceae bacterium]
RLTKSRWKLLRERIGKNIINSFQKINLRNENLERKRKMSEEDQIEEILVEASAYNMRKEVDKRAKIHLKNDPLFSKLEAYIYAYNDLIDNNE